MKVNRPANGQKSISDWSIRPRITSQLRDNQLIVEHIEWKYKSACQNQPCNRRRNQWMDKRKPQCTTSNQTSQSTWWTAAFVEDEQDNIEGLNERNELKHWLRMAAEVVGVGLSGCDILCTACAGAYYFLNKVDFSSKAIGDYYLLQAVVTSSVPLSLDWLQTLLMLGPTC